MAEKMKALVITAPGQVEIRDVTMPQPQANEVLIKIDVCLLCTWEQRIYKNGGGMQLPFVPGHEIAGTIAAIPEDTVTSFHVGDRVVAKTLDSCGHCEFCYRGDDNNCIGTPKKRFYDGIPASGGLAQYIALPVNRVYHLPNQEVEPAIAAFAEPVACCLRSLDRANICMSEDVAIIGAGIMGQLHNLLSKKRGARTIVVDLDDARLEAAKASGADEIVNPQNCDPVETIKALTGGRGAHVIFFTLPVPALAEEYLKALGKLGRMVYYGSFSPKDPIQINPNSIHYTEQVITGSYSPTSQGFWTASRLLSYGLVDVRPYLSGLYGLENADEAFQRAMSPDTYRIGIKLWE